MKPAPRKQQRETDAFTALALLPRDYDGNPWLAPVVIPAERFWAPLKATLVTGRDMMKAFYKNFAFAASIAGGACALTGPSFFNSLNLLLGPQNISSWADMAGRFALQGGAGFLAGATGAAPAAFAGLFIALGVVAGACNAVPGLIQGVVIGGVHAVKQSLRLAGLRPRPVAIAGPGADTSFPKVSPRGRALKKSKSPGTPRRTLACDVFVLAAHIIADMFGRPRREVIAARMVNAVVNDHPRTLRRAASAPNAPIDNRFRIGDYEGSLGAYCVERDIYRCLGVLAAAGADFNNPVDEGSPAAVLASRFYRPTCAGIIAHARGADPERMRLLAARSGNFDVVLDMAAADDLSGAGQWRALKTRFAPEAVAGREAGEEVGNVEPVSRPVQILRK